MTNFLATIKREKLFIALFLLSLIIKVNITRLGHNADLESWQIVGDIVSQGKTIYDNTARYNYGPLWGYICGIVALTVKGFGAINVYTPWFHVLIAGFLATVDGIIAYVLMRTYNKTTGILFLLNPISIILTGSHSQFDNLAILTALIGWKVYLQGKTNKAYFIFGISMILKHILLFFPIWLIVIEITKCKNLRTFMKESVRIALIYLMFFSSFFIEIIRGFDHRDAIIQAIIKNVIMYRGYGASVGRVITDLTVPNFVFNASKALPVFNGYMLFYILFITLVGIVVIRRQIDTKYIFPLYLLTFFSFSYTVANQYIAIPLIAIFVFHDRIESVLYTLLGWCVVVSSTFFNVIQGLFIEKVVSIASFDYVLFPWSYRSYVSYNNAQIWSVLLLIGILIFPTVNYMKKAKLYLYSIVFIFTYLTLALYVMSINTLDAESKVQRVNTNQTVKVSCQSSNSLFKTYTSIQAPDLDNEVIQNISACPTKLPNW